MTYIIYSEDTHNRRLGGKASALAALQNAGLPIPAWFVLAPDAFYARDSNSDTPIEAVWEELNQAIALLCPNGEMVAVRSSAIDEDGSDHSFAGQLESFLFVPPAEVPDKVVLVWESGFSDRLLAYRSDRNLGPPQPPAVLIQRMVNADVAGVAFGADPVTGKRGVAIVTAVYGLGTSLVSGEYDADTYHVDRLGQIVNREIALKTVAYRYHPDSTEGVSPIPVPEDMAKKPALTNEQILAVAQLVRRTQQHFGRPQDVEWAIADGKLFLLQSRPITSIAKLPDPDGILNLWDNSNIAESYNGVTTPLTFSFARRAYEEVYRQFCRLMGVPAATIAENNTTFSRMLGLIKGRVYYNLLSWYRVLAMLPGFTVNRGFMEQMMGVKEPLSDDILAQIQPAVSPTKLQDASRLLFSIIGLVGNYFQLPSQIDRFYERLNLALKPRSLALEELRADELAAYYRDLSDQLLTRWDAPLVNDFFAMIFYGVLRKLTEKWCGDSEGTLQNDLISAEGGMISAEPAKRVLEMAQIAAESSSVVGAENFVNLLCNGSLYAIMRIMEKVSAYKVRYEEYLAKFGDRCMEELKLESPTLYDDPLPLLRAIGQLAQSYHIKDDKLSAKSVTSKGGVSPPLPKLQAEERVRSALRSHPVRQVIFNWVLKNARNRVRDRENLRFERTRLFGRVRRIFVEIGKRFHALDLLDSPRDIFYLETDEIFGFIEGTASSTNLKGLVALRQEEFAGYREAPAPPDRFETRGIVHQGNPFDPTSFIIDLAEQGDSRKGMGCCPGVVKATVRVITDPKNAVLEKGSILVAERTDPGWIMLFPAAAGLLVERGSLLSHSAIVAREMGIPAIVSIAGVTRWLKDGDLVEMDGSTGVVRKVAPHGF